MMSLGSLRAFLKQVKWDLKYPGSPATFVVGNESCDLDSVTSALIYAYFGTKALRSSRPVGWKSPPETLIPLLNIPRDEIAIRPELLTLLRHVNLEPSLLPSLDDMAECQTELSPEQTSWILVDHNALTGPLANKFADKVVGCIDHHIDEKKVPKTEAAPRIIQTSGSCTSLVVNHFRSVWDEMTKSANSKNAKSSQGSLNSNQEEGTRTLWDAEIAKLAMASILVDTQNLENKSKTVDSDVQAVQYLQSKIEPAQSSGAEPFNRIHFYQEIDNAKSDVSNMNVRDCLRKDYKQWTEEGEILGVTTVVTSLEVLAEKSGGLENLQKDIQSFSANKQIDTCVIMTAFVDSKDNKFRRELLILPIKKDLNSFAADFETKCGEQLQLQKHEISLPNSSSKVWWQENLAASRKQVAPLLRDFLRSSDKRYSLRSNRNELNNKF